MEKHALGILNFNSFLSERQSLRYAKKRAQRATGLKLYVEQ